MSEAWRLLGWIRNGMGADAVDVDADGDFDLVVSDTTDRQAGNVGCALFINRVSEGQGFLVVNFPNIIGAGFGWGMGFEDVDNDGDFDLHMGSRGDVPDMLYRHDGFFTVVEDADQALVQVPLYVNVSGMAGTNRLRNSRRTAYADFNRDGRMDILVDSHSENNQPSLSLFLNDSPTGGNHWLQVKLVSQCAPGNVAPGPGTCIITPPPGATGGHVRRRERERERDRSRAGPEAGACPAALRYTGSVGEGSAGREGCRRSGTLAGGSSADAAKVARSRSGLRADAEG